MVICQASPEQLGVPVPFSWHASCLPWLREREVALIGADTPQDVQPSGYE
jgi:hypothetical protein